MWVWRFATTLPCLLGYSTGTAVISFITKKTSKARSFHFNEQICGAVIPVAVNYYNKSLKFENRAQTLRLWLQHHSLTYHTMQMKIMTAVLKKWQYGNDNRVLKPPCVSHMRWWITCCSVHSRIIAGERHQCKFCIKAPKHNTEKRFSMPTTPSSLKLHRAKTIRTFTSSASATVILFTHSSLRQQALIYYFNPAFKKVMIQFYCWHESKFEFKSEPQKTMLSWAKISCDSNESSDHTFCNIWVLVKLQACFLKNYDAVVSVKSYRKQYIDESQIKTKTKN